ncbi:unnamed protein product [Adineta steineri]|uniref:Poly [ADP-ribose] polymerase n=2 Tax=Adineta steineri TaxID=433720 RepID=A0A815CNM6_9BILA|nr:unnamed protein product [Adineta steineri]CAF3818000.1 unnamed protein product [Adineta steineri]CAF4041888.1 unnamed protein product [Adineta steineri]
MIIINGKKPAVNASKVQIQNKIREFLGISIKEKGNYPKDDPRSSSGSPVEPKLWDTTELSIAETDFLINFGQKILNTIEKELGINNTRIVNGKLILSGNTVAITKIYSYLENTLYVKKASITHGMKRHLELNCNGRLWKDFSERHHVGTSFEHARLHKNNNGYNSQIRDSPYGRQMHHAGGMCSFKPNSTNRDVNFGPDQLREGDRRGNCNRGQRGGGRFHEDQSMRNSVPDLRNLNLTDYRENVNKRIIDVFGQGNRRERYNAKNTEYEDETNQGEENYDDDNDDDYNNDDDNDDDYNDDDDNDDDYNDNDDNDNDDDYNDDDDDDKNNQLSDSDMSLSSHSSIVNFTTDNFPDRTQQLVEITLCSVSEVSLADAISELQSYSFNIKSWVLSDEELTFILKQQRRGKPLRNNMPIKEQSMQIKFYFRDLIQNPSLYIFICFTRGIWHVEVSGFKAHVHSAVLKVRDYLNDVVDTEVQIPISGVMASFLRKKASSDINRLEDLHNIEIDIFSPSRRNDNINEDGNDNHCLILMAPVSRIHLAQTKVETFLEDLFEQQQNFPCNTWDISKIISENIITFLKKIYSSDDYDAVGFVKSYNSSIERRQTTPKVTITVVALNEEMADNVIQQCKNLAEGYYVWQLSLDEYRTLHNILLVQRRPSITQLKQEWNTNVQLEDDTNTIIIPARSRVIADEIKDTLRNLAAGKPNRIASISITIPIHPNIRRFIYPAIQPLLNEVKTKGVYIDSKDRNGLTLHGRSEAINSVQDKINTVINDIKQKIVINRLTLPFVESELLRVNLYEIPRRIECDTNTVIRDVKIDMKILKSNSNYYNDGTNLTLTCVANSRGQTILIKKGDITKIKDVDAIVNAANGPLYHAGGVDKAISDAAGPALDQECKELIAKNRNLPILTGTAVKTTAGYLPYKAVIHAIGPQYTDGNQQERPLLFSSVLSSLRLAEQEGYNSVALPAISAATYGFPLQDCTNILIRAIKQFFADFSQSNLRKVVLLDIDDVACNSFAHEVVHDHTNVDANNDDDITNCNLPLLTARWCWLDDNGEKNYDDNHMRQIEHALQQYVQTSIPSTLKLDCDNLKTGNIIRYNIYFLPNLSQVLTINPSALDNRLVCGYQKNERTHFQRGIIRYPLSLQPQTTSVAYKPKPLDTYHLNIQPIEDDWDITGITNEKVIQAEKAIKKAIESATISEPFSINLSEDIDAHKTAINNIAIQQSIKVDFRQDSTGNLSLKLNGLQQNVLQAKLQISLYVQDILRMEVDKDNELNIPNEWGEQEEQCKLVKLPKNHPDFIRIENRMKETISNVKIDKIERVQNLRLWNHYAFRRRTLRQELSDKPNLQIEMELFHGTRATLPSEIYNGEYGFDMSYCTSGLWGLGTYFAMNASYSCQSYSYALADGKRQVFLAQVLTGDVFDYKNKNDPTLRRAPKKNESTSGGTRYNSVLGETGGSKVYIVFENRVAYPTFLITFTQ